MCDVHFPGIPSNLQVQRCLIVWQLKGPTPSAFFYLKILGSSNNSRPNCSRYLQYSDGGATSCDGLGYGCITCAHSHFFYFTTHLQSHEENNRNIALCAWILKWVCLEVVNNNSRSWVHTRESWQPIWRDIYGVASFRHIPISILNVLV